MRMPGIRALIALILIMAAAALAGRAADCASLSRTSLPDTTLTTAQSMPAGRFVPPYGRPVDKLPAFCRLAGVIRPTSDSDIRFEVWLPASDWNGKFLSVGNGGFAGSINYYAMADDLRRGYATAATDTGHEGDAEDASWAFKHPEKVVDFGYRGLHATAENAKALIQTFYNSAVRHSYFDSCSDGGREALMEAQRFPEDFDGILAGAPANFWTHMLAAAVEIIQGMYGKDPSAYIPSAKLPAIQSAALAACDAQDGVKDGIISDPLRCHFDPSVLLCKGKDSRDCLTAPQLSTLKNLYAGAQDSHGKQIFPGYMPGAEDGPAGWAPWITGSGTIRRSHRRTQSITTTVWSPRWARKTRTASFGCTWFPECSTVFPVRARIGSARPAILPRRARPTASSMLSRNGWKRAPRPAMSSLPSISRTMSPRASR